MSTFSIDLAWRRTTPDFDYKTFDRGHTWQLSGGQTVQGSSAPEFSGDPQKSNPEEALLAALASCHMLTFLSVAALKKWVVESYEDHPVAELGKNEKGKIMVTRLTLQPKVTFSGESIPDRSAIEGLHHKAEENCFIGNSLLSSVVVEPRY